MANASAGGTPAWMRWAVAGLGVVALIGIAVYLYRALDALYPQPLWKYFRPEPTLAAGSILYRTMDGQLFLASSNDVQQARRLLDPVAAASGREVVRDALALPGGQRVAYFATERLDGAGEADMLKLISLDGSSLRSVALAPAGEALRPVLYTSASGRYVALTSKDRTRVYYVDTETGMLATGEADAPPERMLWSRNADSHAAALAGQASFATSGSGKLRAQLRDGHRRAPACGEARCEAVQELSVGPAGVAVAGAQPFSVIYGAYRFFSAEGWGLIPAQPAQRIYGRLVWSPDDTQILFTTLDGAEGRAYAITVDGRTRPRLVLQDAEALDWLP